MLAMHAASPAGTPRAAKISRVSALERAGFDGWHVALHYSRACRSGSPEKSASASRRACSARTVRYDGGHSATPSSHRHARARSSSGCRCVRRSRSASACPATADPPGRRSRRAAADGREDGRGSHRADAALGARPNRRAARARSARLRAQARLALVRPRPRARLRRGRQLPGRVGRGLFAAAAHRRAAAPAGGRGRPPDRRRHPRELHRARLRRRARWQRSPRPAARAATSWRFTPRTSSRSPAHSPRVYAELGRLVAGAGPRLSAETLATYGTRFAQALAVRATRARGTSTCSSIWPASSSELARRTTSAPSWPR